MYSKELYKIYEKGLQEAIEVVRQLESLSIDDGEEYMTKCEGNISEIIVRASQIRINLSLWSHREPLFSGLDGDEKKEHKRDNQRARNFVKRILEHFKVQARRDESCPETLLAKIGNVELQVFGWPTKLTYKCEKNCVAILPGGKEVPIAEAPLDL